MADEDTSLLDDVESQARAETLEGAGARKIARGQVHKTPEGLEPLPVVTDETSYGLVEPGKQFKDPEGNVRTKMFEVQDENDYESVPEGAQYLDPEGNTRKKPSYENVSFTAHTLYNMAVNDTERRKALERSYPGMVKQDHKGEFYVEEEDGTLRKPRRAADPKAGGLQTGALIASGAAPTAGSVAGEVAGGLIGSAVPGPGTVAGAITGAGVGAGLGQAFNDIFLKWAGVYDRSVGEQLTETGLAAGFGAGGAAVGRAAAAAYPYVVGSAKVAAPGAAAKFLGADREALETAIRLGEEGEHESSSRLLRAWGMSDPGTASPTSTWAKEAPNLQLTTEVLHPTFFTQKPLQQSATAKMERTGTEILGDLGVTVEGKLTDPTAAVSGREAGQKLLDRAAAQSAAAEEELQARLIATRAAKETELMGSADTYIIDNAINREGPIEVQVLTRNGKPVGIFPKDGGNPISIEKMIADGKGVEEAIARALGDHPDPYKPDLSKVRAKPGAPRMQQTAHEERLTSLREAARAADDAATRVVDAGYANIRTDVENAMRAARAGHNSGDFWTSVADKFREIRTAVGVRANTRYRGWEEAHGTIIPEQQGLVDAAQEFLEELPQPFREMWPTLVKRLARLAGEEGAEELPAPASLAELHDIRTLFRDGSDWSALASDVKNGSMKRFATLLDEVMHGGPDFPALQQAGRDLDVIDQWYAKNIRIFNDQRVQAIVDGMKNGQPADPKAVVELMIKENNTDLNNKLRRMLGPNLWAGIRGSHADALIRRNQTLEGTVDGTAFARDVLADYNSGLLRSIHGEEGAARLFRQAQYAAALEGKLDVAVRPGDTVLDVIGQARAAAAAIKEEAEKNPLALLKQEMNKLKQSEQLAQKEARAARGKDPLRFLYDRTTGAAEAVDKILKKEDLIIATEARFGRNSDEFKALQQVAAQRILSGTLDPGAKLTSLSPEVQELLFHTSLDDAIRLAKDMKFLVGESGGDRSGASIMATSRVTHPWGGSGAVGKFMTGPLKFVPGVNPGGRAMLAKYYDLITKFQESPSFQRWVLKGLDGDDKAREIVKATVQRWAQRGGAAGAGLGESQYQMVEPPVPEPVQ